MQFLLESWKTRPTLPFSLLASFKSDAASNRNHCGQFFPGFLCWVSCIDPWSYTMGGGLNGAPQRCPCPNPGTSGYVMLGGRRNFADVMKGPEMGRPSWWGPCSRRRAGVRSENGSRGRSDGGRGPARAGRHLQEEPPPTLNRF